MKGNRLSDGNKEEILQMREKGMSYLQIANHFGLKDHTSIMYWVHKGESKIERIVTPRFKSVPVNDVIDKNWYPEQVRKMRENKPLFKKYVAPTYELPEDHWLKPYVNKIIYLND